MSLHTPDRHPDTRPGESDAPLRHDDASMDLDSTSVRSQARPSRRSHIFLRLLRRFNASSDGNIAIMTALLMMPMLGLAGLAIDYASVARSKDRLDQAAMIAATAAANTTRNYINITSADGIARTDLNFRNNADNPADSDAKLEGERVGQTSFTDQAALVRNVTISSKIATVTRVGNTINASVTYNANQSTLLLGVFRIPTLPFSGKGTMIVGLQDTKGTDLTIDERWSADNLTSFYTLPTGASGPVIKDWYAPAGSARITIGPPAADDPVAGTALNTIAAAQAMVGRTALTIGTGGYGSLSKKVYLPVGDYELSYWYRSLVIYDSYEPVNICGSEYREWDWVTSSSWRNTGGSGSGQLVSAGMVYLDPILTNPQQANTAPSTFSTSNLLDGCAYSSRWIQRVASFRVDFAGYYWLSFVAPRPPSPASHQGFNLGQVKLCAGVGCVGTPYNNSPWKSQPVLLSTDSFETRSPVGDQSNFDLMTPFGYTNSFYHTLYYGWNVRTWSVTTTINPNGLTTDTNNLTARETWTASGTNAPIIYRTGTAYAGSNVVEFAQASKTLSRTLLLTPGVYKQTFQSLSAPRQPSFYCNDADDKAWFTATYFRTDFPSLSYGYNAPPAILADGGLAERGMFTKAKAYTCNTGISYTIRTMCFLIIRTHYYDIGVLSRDFPGERIDDMRVSLLTSKITDPTQPVDPNTWDPRNTSGPRAALAANPDCGGGIVAVIGGSIGWPSYTTFTRGGGRYVVTQSKYP